MAKNCINELVDPSLGNSYNCQQMDLLVLIASLCVDQSSNRRLQMRQVVQILSGEKASLEQCTVLAQLQWQSNKQASSAMPTVTACSCLSSRKRHIGTFSSLYRSLLCEMQ